MLFRSRLFYVLVFWIGILAGKSVFASELFAQVEGVDIPQIEFETAVHVAMRQRFYHGKFDDERLKQLRNEVAGHLIDQVLLLKEAARRKIQIDKGIVERELNKQIGRYRFDKMSKAEKTEVLARLREQVEEQVLLDELERLVRHVKPPKLELVRAYYQEHSDKFTTPEQLRVSVILLKVAPSSPVATWKAAQAEGEKLYRRLKEGADFAELAQMHSGDGSADAGGDLGFLHQGMLGDEAQAVVDKLAVGEVSKPVLLLQGVALFEVTARREAVLNSFEHVKERAQGLLQRERSEQAWEGLLRALRSKAQIEIFDDEIITKMIWVDVPAAGS